MNNNERIARWRYGTDPILWLTYDTMICHWHGPDGLLAEIKKRGKIRDFTRYLAEIINRIGIAVAILGDYQVKLGTVWDSLWPLIDHEPSQLTAALVKMIEEEKCTEAR